MEMRGSVCQQGGTKDRGLLAPKGVEVRGKRKRDRLRYVGYEHKESVLLTSGRQACVIALVVFQAAAGKYVNHEPMVLHVRMGHFFWRI